MERCKKRRRLSYAPLLHAIHSSKGKISAELSNDSARNLDLDSGIAEKRALLDKRLKATFESIFEKYGKDFEGIGDEIDIATGEIVVNNGHLLRMQNESDAGDSLCFRKNEENILDWQSEDLSALSSSDLEHKDYLGLKRNKNSDSTSDEVTPNSEEDCLEDDLILRGFSQVNRLLKYTSEEASCHMLPTTRRGSWISTQTPSKLRATFPSDDKFFSRIKTLGIHPSIFEQTPNYAVWRGDDIEPARQFLKHPTLQRKFSIESYGKGKILKQSTSRAGKSFFIEPVESFCSSTQLRKSSKLKKLDSRIYINENSSLKFNKTEKSVRSYVNGVCQNYIYSLIKSKSQSLRKQENLSESSSQDCPSSYRDPERHFEAEIKRIKCSSKISLKNGSNKKTSAQLQTGLTLNDIPEVIKIPSKDYNININLENCPEASLEEFKKEKPQHKIPAHNVSECYLSPTGSFKANETSRILDSDSPTNQTKDESKKIENIKGFVPTYDKIINQTPRVFESYQNSPLLQLPIQATTKQFYPVSLPRTQFGNNYTKDQKANSSSQTPIPLSLNGLHVNLDLSHKIQKFEDRKIPILASHYDNVNHILEHPNQTPENTNAKKSDVVRVEPARPQRLTNSDLNKKPRFKCTDLESKLNSNSSISLSKSDKKLFKLRMSKIQEKSSNIMCATNNYESLAMSKEPYPSNGSNGKITTSCEEKPCSKPKFFPDISTSQPSFQDFHLTQLPTGKRGEKQNSTLKVATTYETPKRPEPDSDNHNTSNSNLKSSLSTNASKSNENCTKLSQCYLPTPAYSSEATLKQCVPFDEHSRSNLNKANILSPVNQKLQHKFLAETVWNTHQSLSHKSDNRANVSSSIFPTETRPCPGKERKRSPIEDGNPQECKADASDEISGIKKGKKYDILRATRDVDLSLPRKLLKNGAVNTPSMDEKPKTPNTANELYVGRTKLKVLTESKHGNSTCGVLREDITRSSRKISCRSLKKTTKDLIKWPLDSEEIDELSFDLPDKSSIFVLGPCTENKAVSSSSRALSTIKRKRKSSLTNSVEESDVDELGL